MGLERHRSAVARIATSIRGFYDRQEPFRIFHGSTNSTRPIRRKHEVDISDLRNVLQVDPKTRTALVEPNVPMDRLVEATLKYGLVPPVVMEFPGITAGGGYAGTAGESSSFKYGFFDRTINSVEMVMADGTVLKASEKENADLFRGAAGAAGSLGVTTMMELQLIEAKKFVKATYHPQQSVKDSVHEVHSHTLDDRNDYVDGILYGPEHGVVVAGEMTDEIPDAAHVQTFSHAWDPWFYMHVQEKTRGSKSPVTDYVPLAEYLFRYDRGGFWVGRSAFKYFQFPFNRATRWVLDDFLHTRMLYKALHASGESSRYIIQDLALPYSTAESFIDYTSEKLGIWPLWLCPLKQSPAPTFHPHATVDSPGFTADQMLNIGVWGFGPKDPETFVTANRDLERRLRELGGMKWFYAHAYYSEDEFWNIYNRAWYNGLRHKYAAETLPTVYDKVKIDVEADRKERAESWSRTVRSIWPVGGLWGIRKAIESKEYLIHRNSTWKWKS
ncbi:24-dehydrocholesterol reductase precursor [Aspergillus rambellii]|uniref:Delta(24)-sterol reductase n=1 Tax=Aspergillus rambellii TaxID=308745 RepID=A0A0F8TZC7_9EURO|nr:24-dehydrocholesterol reductase precursor [Aspergillus rambellii]